MKIKCLLCNNIIESKRRHNLLSCKCDNFYIDGGQDFSKILIIFDDGTEILATDKKKYKKKYGEWNEKVYRLKEHLKQVVQKKSKV